MTNKISLCCVISVVGDGKCFGDVMWAGIWRKEIPHVGNIHAKIMDSIIRMLHPTFTLVHICRPIDEVFRPTGRRFRYGWSGGLVVVAASLQLRLSVPTTKVPTMPA